MYIFTGPGISTPCISCRIYMSSPDASRTYITKSIEHDWNFKNKLTIHQWIYTWSYATYLNFLSKTYSELDFNSLLKNLKSNSLLLMKIFLLVPATSCSYHDMKLAWAKMLKRVPAILIRNMVNSKSYGESRNIWIFSKYIIRIFGIL